MNSCGRKSLMRLIKLKEVFEAKYGVNLDFNSMTISDAGIPFVSRQEKNNGVVARVKEIEEITPNPAHTLSVAGGGSVLATFYQPEPYYSGRDLYYLVPKEEMNVMEMLIYSRFINSNKYKYSYGRQANRTLKELLIPDRVEVKFLCSKLKMLEQPSQEAVSKNNFSLNAQNWKNFRYSELFNIKGSKTTPIAKLEEYGKGEYPYVTTQAGNNGIEGFYDFYTEQGNVLTVDSAVLGYCSYQKDSFSASDHVEKLVPKFQMNKYIAMFLMTILNREQYRYNYGRKCSQSRMENCIIKLPVNAEENPDWQFMEDYIKSLPYSSNL